MFCVGVIACLFCYVYHGVFSVWLLLICFRLGCFWRCFSVYLFVVVVLTIWDLLFCVGSLVLGVCVDDFVVLNCY